MFVFVFFFCFFFFFFFFFFGGGGGSLVGRAELAVLPEEVPSSILATAGSVPTGWDGISITGSAKTTLVAVLKIVREIVWLLTMYGERSIILFLLMSCVHQAVT